MSLVKGRETPKQLISPAFCSFPQLVCFIPAYLSKFNGKMVRMETCFQTTEKLIECENLFFIIMSYHEEKFALAIEMLACETGSIQERLFNAVVYNNFVMLEGYFPKDNLREVFRDLMNELTKEEPLGNEGSLKATIEKMSSEKASELARKIVDMYWKISSLK